MVTVSAVAALLGLAAASGLLLVATGWSPRAGPAEPRPARARSARVDARRLLAAVAATGAILLATRWPVAGLAAGAAGWFGPELLGGRVARRAAVERTEAIAAWTEMLRDTMAAAHGLEEAISTTAVLAPDPIRPEVVALAARLEREPLAPALRGLADDLAHPTADLVVAALALAADGAVRELGELLGTLAVAARDEAGMRLRVEAARARTRTAVRVVCACTVGTALGLVLLNRSYLEVYATALGQAVLALIVTCWGLSLWWLVRMGEFAAPERFLAADAEGRTER